MQQFAQRVEVEETHTHNPFDLSKPLRGFGAGDPIVRRWWEPSWLWERRKRREAEWSVMMAEGDLRTREWCRGAFKHYCPIP